MAARHRHACVALTTCAQPPARSPDGASDNSPAAARPAARLSAPGMPLSASASALRGPGLGSGSGTGSPAAGVSPAPRMSTMMMGTPNAVKIGAQLWAATVGRGRTRCMVCVLAYHMCGRGVRHRIGSVDALCLAKHMPVGGEITHARALVTAKPCSLLAASGPATGPAGGMSATAPPRAPAARPSGGNELVLEDCDEEFGQDDAGGHGASMGAAGFATMRISGGPALRKPVRAGAGARGWGTGGPGVAAGAAGLLVVAQ